MNPILKDFRMFDASNMFLDVVDVTPPEIENATATASGPGVLGELEIPILGAVGNLAVTINFHSINRQQAGLMTGAKQLEFRGVEQIYDAAIGEFKEVASRYVMKTLPKKLSPGTLNKNNPNGSSFEGNLSYYKIEHDGEVITEIDKFANICIIDGEDLMAETKAMLGIQEVEMKETKETKSEKKKIFKVPPQIGSLLLNHSVR